MSTLNIIKVRFGTATLTFGRRSVRIPLVAFGLLLLRAMPGAGRLAVHVRSCAWMVLLFVRALALLAMLPRVRLDLEVAAEVTS